MKRYRWLRDTQDRRRGDERELDHTSPHTRELAARGIICEVKPAPPMETKPKRTRKKRDA